jgi:2-amino-4-hydroxy-6-hydroxymethyldihydropteridine diphosphokinase
MRAVLALGSNLGDRGATLVEAVRRLALVEGVEVVAASDLVETVALTLNGPDPDAPGYLNGVVITETSLSPEQLLHAANAIEADLGRVRGERWADRTLDIDLIDVEGQTRDSERLTLPHPRAAERTFVLAPWLAIDAQAELAGVRVADLLARLEQ